MRRKKIHTDPGLTEEELAFNKQLENDLLLKVHKELVAMKGNPRSQIFVVHGFLELLINTIVKGKAKNGSKIAKDNRTYSYAVQLIILHEMGEISDVDFKVFEWFRKLRNKAAHEPLFSLTDEDVSKLPQEYRDIKKFELICQDLMFRLWNQNVQLLVPVFMPTLLPRMKENEYPHP
jgi:hypothetical protein